MQGRNKRGNNIQRTRSQRAFFDDIFKNMKVEGKEVTTAEIFSVANELNKKKKEEERLEAERKRIADEKKAEQKKLEQIRWVQYVNDIFTMKTPDNYENPYKYNNNLAEVHFDELKPALNYCLITLGKIDIEYIAFITNLTLKDTILGLKGDIYQNPETWQECFYKGWELAEDYLAGNIYIKHKKAVSANEKYNGYFTENVMALDKVMPPEIHFEDIYVTLGSPFVPADMIDDFIDSLLGASYISGSENIKTKYEEVTGTWEIPYKGRYFNNPRSYMTYGTKRMDALQIIEKTLNMKNIAVTEDSLIVNSDGMKKRILNKVETALAIEKQKIIKEEFYKFVSSSEKRKQRIVKIYTERYASYRNRTYNGDILPFTGMSKDVSLYPYQKNAVARIIFNKNTLLSHDVGSGKTYVMVSAGMELKRMGLSTKNLYVVPNNIIGQWKNIFLSIYPNAKLLVVEPKHFIASKRQAMLKIIRDGEYDGIIMAYSCFDIIPMSANFYRGYYRDKRDFLEKCLKDNTKAAYGLQREKLKAENELAELKGIHNDGITFDELNITRIFVDEAHNYKNLPIHTKADNVLGITVAGSKKCREMFFKTLYLEEHGGGIIMATGTPITNSITDAYVMQKYLQKAELEERGLRAFDSWIGMFAERKSEFEIDVDTNSYRLASRFSAFHNLTELTTLFSLTSDFHHADFIDEMPEFKGYTDIIIKKTELFTKYLARISERADDVRNGIVKRTEDNMLKITTDGRKAALDLRLVFEEYPFTTESKVAYCAKIVTEIYNKYNEDRLTQLIFCDTSVPKLTFNIYDEMFRLLTENGIRPDEIAYIHDVDSDDERDILFAEMREGKKRILIGSTLKLGLGVNVQDKLVAVHHLDIPWRPSDMVQREGRILRPGNHNKEIFIYRYITEGSFDAYSWQLLESKQNFISALLSGTLEERSGTDIDDTVLNYAEVKALAIGNPLIKKRVEASNELLRLTTLQKKLDENRIVLEEELQKLPDEISVVKSQVDGCKADIEYYKTHKQVYSQDDRKALRTFIYNSVKDNEYSEKELFIDEYQGFKVYVPVNVTKEKLAVYVRREGSYFVELGESDMGVLTRIDNMLDNLPERLDDLKNMLNELNQKRIGLTEELNKKENYEQEILKIQAELSDIDKKLGVLEEKKL